MITRAIALSGVESLARRCGDASQGFRAAARVTKDEPLAAALRALASTRTRLQDELRAHLRLRGRDPGRLGTRLGRLNRAWLGLRAALNGGDPRATLAEVERAERALDLAYEEVQRLVERGSIAAALRRHRVELARGRERLRALREERAASVVRPEARLDAPRPR